MAYFLRIEMFKFGNQNHIESFSSCENLTGKILLASPIMDDEYFKRSMIYICSHDDNGAVGVMINRVINEVDLCKSIDIKSDSDNYLIPLYSGGSISIEKTVALTIRKNYYRDFNKNPVITIFTDLEDFKHAFNSGTLSKKFLIAQGITAWDGKQLASEVNQNFWIVIETTREAIFSHKEKAWEREIKKIGLKPNSKHIVNYTGQA